MQVSLRLFSVFRLGFRSIPSRDYNVLLLPKSLTVVGKTLRDFGGIVNRKRGINFQGQLHCQFSTYIEYIIHLSRHIYCMLSPN